MIGSVFVSIIVSSTLYTISETPIYEATTQVLIEKESSNIINFKEAFEQNQTTDDYYQTQYRILHSRGLARRTINALNLRNSSAPPVEVTPPSPILQSMAMLTTLLKKQRNSLASLEQTAPDETASESAAIDQFLSALTIAPVRASRLVDVKFAGPDPVLAAKISNALAKAYIEQNLEFKFMSSKEASDWLARQLAEQRKQVEASEQALQRYREQTDAVSLEDKQNIVVQKLSDLNAAVTRAKTERFQKRVPTARSKPCRTIGTHSIAFP